MSYYDPDNLPSGVSPFDAPGMGISPWDSRSTAVDKYNTEIARQGMEATAQFWREQDASLQNGASAAGPAGAYGTGSYTPSALSNLLKQLSPGKINNTRELAAILADKQRKLERERLQATRGLKPAAVLSFAAAAVLLFMVLFHVQFFNASFRQVTYEYFIVRVGLLAALFCGWKLTSVVRRAFTEAEKSCSLQLLALRQALGQARSKDWMRNLNRDSLAPRFIQDFNVRHRKLTGKDMPYVVYQYKELYDQRLCLVPDASTLNAADLQLGHIVPLEQLCDVKLPSA